MGVRPFSRCQAPSQDHCNDAKKRPKGWLGLRLVVSLYRRLSSMTAALPVTLYTSAADRLSVKLASGENV